MLSSLMLVALALRVKGIGTTNLWYDEANSWYVAHLSWPALIDNVRSSPLGPLYFVFLKLWMTLFGDSEAALRTPSLIASLLVIPATYVIGARVFTRRAAALGASLLTISPLQLYFAQEARMYMPLTLMAVLAFIAYLRWRDATFAPDTGGATCDPGSARPASRVRAWRALAWYTIIGTAMVHTNIVSATFIAALNVDAARLLIRHGSGRKRSQHRGAGSDAADAAARTGQRPRAAIAWIAANAIIAVTLLLYARGVRLNLAGASQEWRSSPGAVSALRALFEYPLVALHGVYYYPRDFSAAAASFQGDGSISTFLHMAELFVVQPLALIIAVIVLGAGAARFFNGSRRSIALAVVIPLILGTTISAWREVDLARYFLFASPFLYLLLGFGVERLSESSGAASGALAFAILLLVSAFGIRGYERVDTRDSDYRPVVSAIAHERNRAGAIFVLPEKAAEPLYYYLRHERVAPVYPAKSPSVVARSLSHTPGEPAWLVLDYRSRLYDDSPAELGEGIGARLLGDRYFSAGGGGVRLVLLEHPLK